MYRWPSPTLEAFSPSSAAASFRNHDVGSPSGTKGDHIHLSHSTQHPDYSSKGASDFNGTHNTNDGSATGANAGHGSLVASKPLKPGRCAPNRTTGLVVVKTPFERAATPNNNSKTR